MVTPCDYPIDLHGIVSSPASIPDRKVLYTGYAFLVDTAFTCPITSIVFKAGDLIFWDEVYSTGTWRVMRDLLEDLFYTWSAIWACPNGPWGITLVSSSSTGVITPWYRTGDNFVCVTKSPVPPSAPDQWLRPVYAYFNDSYTGNACSDNVGSITCSVSPVSGGAISTHSVDAVINCVVGGPGVYVGSFLPGVYRFTYISGATKCNPDFNWNNCAGITLSDMPTYQGSSKYYGDSVVFSGPGYPVYEDAEAAWAGTYQDVNIC